MVKLLAPSPWSGRAAPFGIEGHLVSAEQGSLEAHGREVRLASAETNYLASLSRADCNTSIANAAACCFRDGNPPTAATNSFLASR
jgi:hypothetical protein